MRRPHAPLRPPIQRRSRTDFFLPEYLPFIRRWEYFAKKHEWDYVRLPTNMGGTRDIPPNALFHTAAIERMALDTTVLKVPYRPRNDVAFRDCTTAPLYLAGPKGTTGREERAGLMRPRFVQVAPAKGDARADAVDKLYRLEYE